MFLKKISLCDCLRKLHRTKRGRGGSLCRTGHVTGRPSDHSHSNTCVPRSFHAQFRSCQPRTCYTKYTRSSAQHSHILGWCKFNAWLHQPWLIDFINIEMFPQSLWDADGRRRMIRATCFENIQCGCSVNLIRFGHSGRDSPGQPCEQVW